MSTAPLPQFATLGEMLKYLRRRARLTQRELSIAVGYSESQVSRLEKGERIADAATLQALFVSALDIEDQPDVVRQLLALAAGAHSPTPENAVAENAVPPGTLPVSRQIDELPLTNLPTRLTSFIGREDAITELRHLIASTRLVTLTGVGGVGKTSLASVVGSGLRSTFADGVWWVGLASLTEAALVPQVITTIFKLPELYERTYLEALMTYLRDRHLLLIVDNCEHLIDSCANVVNTLLHSCPQLHIMATSREALRVEGEVEWPVAPLATPMLETGPGKLGMETMMQSYEAVRLFVERVRATQPTFVLTDQNAAPVAQICRQLDGIPLAIELAASRLKGMTVDELAARLHNRFRLLTGGTRTALPRHQTLRAMLDWSYNLLSAEERALLRRLAVFSGGWTLDAAEAIAAGQTNEVDTIHNPVELLLQLVNRSLVVAEAHHRQTRYRLLETIREYSLEKLLEMGEVEAVRARHFAYYLALAEQSQDAEMTGLLLAAWTERIRVEMDNLRGAHAWVDKQEAYGERCLQLAGALWLFWYMFGSLQEGEAWLKKGLAQDAVVTPQTRARALYGLAYFLTFISTPMHITALIEEALLLSTQSDDELGMAHCNILLGEIAHGQANYLQALEHYQRALDLFQASGHLLFFNAHLYDLADVWLHLGQADKALPLFEKAFANATSDGGHLFSDGLATHVWNRLLSADEKVARRLFEGELVRRRALGVPEMLAPLLHAYSRQLITSDDPQDLDYSFEMLTECLALWRQAGVKVSRAGGTARAYMDLGHIHTLKGDYELAIEYEQVASRQYDETGELHGVAWTQLSIGWPALAQGDLALAQASFQKSLHLSPDGSFNSIPYTLIGLAETRLRQGKAAHAGLLFGAAARFNEQAISDYVPLRMLSAMEAARTRLDDPAFAAAWAEGEAMALEQVIAIALE